ncbi:MAG: mechanosensitive ion channel [Xanthomonadales bacterium]
MRILLCGLILLFAAGTLPAQDQFDLVPDAAPPAAWQPPDLAALPADWWLRLDNASNGSFEERFEQLLAGLREAVGRLDGEQLVTGRALLQAIETQFELLRLARAETEDVSFSPIPVRDNYTLEQFLALRHEADDLENRLSVPQLRLEELKHQADLVQARRDSLLMQYQAADANTPERLLLGLRLIEARLVGELTTAESDQLERRTEQIQAQQDLVAQRLDYAQDHLVADPAAPAELQSALDDAVARYQELTETLASVQRQLLDALSTADTRPSVLVLRKQQLTRASVAQARARLELMKLRAEQIWHRQRMADGVAEDIDDTQLEEAQTFIAETRGQVETWTAATRATLLSPVPNDTLNAVKNMELAQSAAQETLTFLDDAERIIDDLNVLADLITVQQIGMQHGLRSVRVRLQLLAEGIGERLSGYLGITLFHVGDVPVTVGSILTMLLILVIGWATSWFIRHLVERLKSRRQFASSPVVYTLSRLLHYVIIFIAVLAAFGSIGLDFSNFALIAGALSVGIGFGLQSVVNNFVSGLILLFEGSLRVGDYIELDTGLRGVVKEVNTRATVVRTNDSVDVVVPNSQFVTNQLTNWTLREPMARFRIEFGVAYGSDKETVRAAALEAANRVDYIVHNMPSRPVEVWLTNFGDSALVFQLLAWVSKAGVRRPERVRSAVLWELETQLSERGIVIPFPQRDLHLRSGFVTDPEDAPDDDNGAATPQPSP